MRSSAAIQAAVRAAVAIIESCASRIFLPNPQATEPQIRTIYEGFGLNSRQIEIVATAQPKRDYYYQSRLGNRVFDLGLGSVALAFAGASTPPDQRMVDAVLAALQARALAWDALDPDTSGAQWAGIALVPAVRDVITRFPGGLGRPAAGVAATSALPEVLAAFLSGFTPVEAILT